MANTANNVSTGKPKVSGAVFRAPLGSTLPTDATTALDNAFVAMGYVNEDGLTNDSSVESDNVKAWGGDIVYSMQTDRVDTFSFTCLESMNLEVLKAFYGDDNVTGTLANGVTVNANSEELGGHCWVFDMVLRGGGMKRIVVPNGMVSETGEVVYVDNEPIGYQLTITAMPDTSGNTHYEYIKRTA